MSQLGISVMINMLGGNKNTVEAFQSAKGKTITNINLEDNSLVFTFSDGTGLKMYDDGQSCCENRYIRTDDTLSDYIGGTLDDAEIRSAPDISNDDEYSDCHEVQFLAIKTSKGQFVMSNHNEHNGYYGGFSIVAETIPCSL